MTENIKLVASLRAEISLYQKNNSELKQLNQVLKDEHQALQLAFTKLEEKLRKSQVILFVIVVIIFNYKKNYYTFLKLLLLLINIMSTRMEGNCSRSREKEGCSDDSKDFN